MHNKLIFAATAVAAVVLSSGSASAQLSSKQAAPRNFTDSRPATSGALTRANFAQFLTNAGFDIKRGYDDSHYIFNVNVGGQTMSFSAWLLDEMNPPRLEITVPLLDLTGDSLMPAPVATRLLAENNHNGSVYFALSECTSTC